jgi:hypothetical protein
MVGAASIDTASGDCRGGLGFATVKNFLYLNGYISNPTPEFVAWRWVLGPVLHATAALLSDLGEAKIWRIADAELTTLGLIVAAPWVIAAVIPHGTLNFLAIGLQQFEPL